MRPDESYHTRHRVRLADGREIEVVYLDGAAFERSRHPDALIPELHVCFHCRSTLVYPLDWSSEGDGSWRLLMRCPECEATREGVFEGEELQRLEQELDEATSCVLRDLQRITRANMAEEIEFFVRAMNADVVVPSDF